VSVAALPSRQQQPGAWQRAERVAPEGLATVRLHGLTNELCQSRGLEANGLTWFWHGTRPSRIREWVTLTADDARIQIALDGEATGLGSEPADWHQYTGDVRLLAWTAYHEPILELLRAVFRREWLPECLGHCDASGDPDDVQAGFSIHTAGGVCVANGLASFDQSHIQTLGLRPDARAARPHELASVRAVLEFCIDEFELSGVELSALHGGSVVRLDNRTLRTAPRVVIPLGAVQAIAEVRDRQVTIVGFAAPASPLTEPNSGVTIMNDSDTPAADRAVDPASLPVTLRFTVGRASLPFGVLAGVAPGFVFEIDKPLDDQMITIHANDVPIAHGELVTLGDLLGVRISRMLPQPK
jgi:flagellar motor switch/type III secretory pathway protein FliN